jgi:hypothetical protein
MCRAFMLIVILAVTVNAQQLGRVEFPTSGSERAQAHFLRGLAALHPDSECLCLLCASSSPCL